MGRKPLSGQQDGEKHGAPRAAHSLPRSRLQATPLLVLSWTLSLDNLCSCILRIYPLQPLQQPCGLKAKGTYRQYQTRSLHTSCSW